MEYAQLREGVIGGYFGQNVISPSHRKPNTEADNLNMSESTNSYGGKLTKSARANESVGCVGEYDTRTNAVFPAKTQ